MFEFDGILLRPCLLQPCVHVAGDPTRAAGPNNSNNDDNNKYDYYYHYGTKAGFQAKNLLIWSLGQPNYYIKEVGFLSAPSNFLAQ